MFKRSFTVIELIVVIAIIGILAALVIVPNLFLGSKVNLTAAQADAKSVAQAVYLFIEKTDEYPIADNEMHIKRDNLTDFYDYMKRRTLNDEGNGDAAPMYFFAINFDKLTKPFLTARGDTLAPILKDVPRTSYYTNASLKEINQSKKVQSFIYVMDKNGNVYLSDNKNDMGLYGYSTTEKIFILDGTINK